MNYSVQRKRRNNIYEEPVNSELRLAVLNFSRIFSFNCS